MLLGTDVHGATLGIVGYGRIGRAVASRGEGFGMRVLHSGRGHDGTPSSELLAESDFVSLHAPLTDETRALIDAAAPARMKPTRVLVNTARGPLVDQDALIAALESGEIAGAALDVTDPEPLPPGHPLLSAPQPDHHPAPRLGFAPGARGDGRPRGGQSARGARRRAAPGRGPRVTRPAP